MEEKKKRFETSEITVTEVNDVIRTSNRDDDEWVILGLRYYW